MKFCFVLCWFNFQPNYDILDWAGYHNLISSKLWKYQISTALGLHIQFNILLISPWIYSKKCQTSERVGSTWANALGETTETHCVGILSQAFHISLFFFSSFIVLKSTDASDRTFAIAIKDKTVKYSIEQFAKSPIQSYETSSCLKRKFSIWL